MKGEKTHITEGTVGSILIHGILLLLLYFFVINPPNPPLGEVGGSGIELNYGVDLEGYGDIQTMNEASEQGAEEEVAPSDEQPSPEQQENSIAEQNPESQEDNSNDLKQDFEETVKLEEKKVEKKIEEVKPIEKPIEKKTNIEVKEQKTLDKSTDPKPNSNGNTGTENKIGANNNGDRPGKVGDQGNPQGSLEAKALYGNLGSGGEGSGGSGGNKLEMSGWKPLFRIDKKDATNENGKIVFQIKVDNQGDLISVLPVEKTVSPAVVEFYKRQIEENWAVERTRENINPPPVSTGRYTVFVRSK
jgi:hypothetical protein